MGSLLHFFLLPRVFFLFGFYYFSAWCGSCSGLLFTCDFRLYPRPIPTYDRVGVFGEAFIFYRHVIYYEIPTVPNVLKHWYFQKP